MWLRLLKIFLSFADKISTHVNRKQMLEAGKAQEAEKRLEIANERIQKAIEVRRAARRDSADGKLRRNMSFREDD